MEVKNMLIVVPFVLQLDLFTALKTVGFLGLFTSITGHFLLSHVADVSSKVKTA
jgi:oligosaccharyltransferase complex subunit delta (ribophorin II)